MRTAPICPSWSPHHVSPEPPTWRTRPYDGGTYHTGDLRFCSYCGSLHPDDLDTLVAAGARLEGTTKPYKTYVNGAPNKVAGQNVRTGMKTGPVWKGGGVPKRRLTQLFGRTDMPADLGPPTLMERLTGQYRRQILSTAPAHLFLKVYAGHRP